MINSSTLIRGIKYCFGEGEDNQVESVGKRNWVLVWRNGWVTKDVFGRKGRGGCVGYVLSIYCSKRGNHPFIAPVLPIPGLGFYLQLSLSF